MEDKSSERELILSVTLDGREGINSTDEVKYEYETAVNDLLAKNYFHLCKNYTGPRVSRGPYNLLLDIIENRLVLNITRMEEKAGKFVEGQKERVTLPMSPFRRLVKDYFFICERYYNAVKTATPDKVQTIDMAKRSLHNEGAALLSDLLKPDIEVDFDTSRRLFTLICVLHIK